MDRGRVPNPRADLGPFGTLTAGNGAYLTVGYDVKRRTNSWNWTDSLGGPLVSLGYGFDDVDNPLHETFGHDLGLSDNFGYNARYEVTGVNYRTVGATDYRTFGGGYATTFAYDDNLNRQSANSNDPFANDPFVTDAYTVNAANEYQTISRNSVFMNPIHDLAGNMTTLPTRPATGASAGLDVTTTLEYDAFNRPITVTAGSNAEQVYLYDALGRRIVAMELAVPYTSSVPTTAITAGRRYIYDGWSVVTERVFSGATLEAAPSTLERIYVEGPMLDEHILCAIDGDGGGLFTNLNEPVSAGGPNTNDYRYYYLPNRLGNTMALLDFNDHRRTLEYYRYTVYGEATVLPVVDVAPADGLEDTPLDLTDNNALMLAQRGPGNPGSLDPTAGRASQFNNQYTFTGRYLDTSTGLHYFRYRYYEARVGRFVSRDPISSPDYNLYSYSDNRTSQQTDVLGLVAIGALALRCALGVVENLILREVIFGGLAGLGAVDPRGFCDRLADAVIGCILGPTVIGIVVAWALKAVAHFLVRSALAASGVAISVGLAILCNKTT